MDSDNLGNAEPLKEAKTALVDPEQLSSFLTHIFMALGLTRPAATRAADILLVADLRGEPSHGCRRLSTLYAPLLKKGIINPAANLQRIRRHTGLHIFDANRGLGLTAAPRAMSLAMRAARRHGIGFTWLVNSTHFGIASYYTLMAASAGMLGIALTTGSPAVAPPGSQRAFLGTNAISLACPHKDNAPFVVDMATSNTSLGHIEDLAQSALAAPAEYAAEALQALLNVTADDSLDPATLLRYRLLSPLGGGRGAGGYKGFALALMIELVTAILPGGDISFKLHHGQACHLLAAFELETAKVTTNIHQALCELADALASTPVLPDYPALRLPGSQANLLHTERLAKGLPLPLATIAALKSLANELQVPTDIFENH